MNMQFVESLKVKAKVDMDGSLAALNMVKSNKVKWWIDAEDIWSICEYNDSD